MKHSVALWAWCGGRGGLVVVRSCPCGLVVVELYERICDPAMGCPDAREATGGVGSGEGPVRSGSGEGLVPRELVGTLQLCDETGRGLDRSGDIWYDDCNV